MLEALYIIVSVCLWIAAPTTLWFVLKYYAKQSLTYRIVLGIVLSTFVVLIFYFLRALLLSEIISRSDQF
ncbi:MAG: hypothetical protein RIT43_2345 [Bacteroidota bacterium]|jgi:hypothetical protein